MAFHREIQPPAPYREQPLFQNSHSQLHTPYVPDARPPTHSAKL